MGKSPYARPSLIKLGDMKSLTLNAAGSPGGDTADNDAIGKDGNLIGPLQDGADGTGNNADTDA